MVWFTMPQRKKTMFCILPRRLCRYITYQVPLRLEHNGNVSFNQTTEVVEIIGWVWMQKSHLEWNMHYGWVCILDSTPYLEVNPIHNHPTIVL
jgi:hypothetical protein